MLSHAPLSQCSRHCEDVAKPQTLKVRPLARSNLISSVIPAPIVVPPPFVNPAPIVIPAPSVIPAKAGIQSSF
jgi:hypothetical protein